MPFKLAFDLQDYGFVQCHLNHSLFICCHGDVFLGLLVYVDGLVLTGNSSSHCKSFKEYLHIRFKLKDLGPLKYFLTIEVAWSPHWLVYAMKEVYSRHSKCGMMGA